MSVIYVAVGIAMLKPGWLDRYQPAIALERVPDVIVVFGYVWAGLMFVSAALNAVLAFNVSFATWAAFMSTYGLASKIGLVVVQVVVSRVIGARRAAAAAMQTGHFATRPG